MLTLSPTLVALALLGGGPKDTPDPAALYQKHAASIVAVHGIVHDDDDSLSWSFGAGVVLSGGRILTACHVVRSGDHDEIEVDEIQVTFGERDRDGIVRAGRRMAAKAIRCDRERDLAILRIADKLPLPKPMKLRPKAVSPGQDVVSLGHSNRGFAWTVHRCSVAGVGNLREQSTDVALAVTPSTAEREKKDIEDDYDKLEVECVGHGMSGSVVVDADGRIAGLEQNSRFQIRKSGTIENTFFYITADEIQTFLDES